MTHPSFDREKIHINLARYKHAGKRFEIVINPEQAAAFKEGKTVAINDIIVYPKIFSDAHKGTIASEKDVHDVFGTTDPEGVAAIILQKGEAQLTAEHREKHVEQVRNRLIDMIHRQGVDPRTHAPHPQERIRRAFEEAKFKVDEHKPAEAQLQDAIKALRPIIPIKVEVKEIRATIPSTHASKAVGVLKQFGKTVSQDWAPDGSCHVVIEIPGGLEQEFYEKMNALTHGQATATVVATRE